jgi:hypothetical protein
MSRSLKTRQTVTYTLVAFLLSVRPARYCSHATLGQNVASNLASIKSRDYHPDRVLDDALFSIIPEYADALHLTDVVIKLFLLVSISLGLTVPLARNKFVPNLKMASDVFLLRSIMVSLTLLPDPRKGCEKVASLWAIRDHRCGGKYTV